MARLNLMILALILGACGSSEDKDKEKIEGWRYRTTLVRAADEVEWTPIQGDHEWWFFKAGVFKQIANAYVEPDFYGSSQACFGQGSGTFSRGEAEEGAVLDKRTQIIVLVYDGVRDLEGLCRMNDRNINVTLQPSGVVDLLDGKRVQRLERMEKLK